MTLNSLFKIISALQGTFVLAMTVLILLNYIYSPKPNPMKLHILFISMSYCLLTIGTIISAMLDAYPHWEIWHPIVIFGWILGILGLVPMFKYMVMTRDNQKIQDYLNKK